EQRERPPVVGVARVRRAGVALDQLCVQVRRGRVLAAIERAPRGAIQTVGRVRLVPAGRWPVGGGVKLLEPLQHFQSLQLRERLSARRERGLESLQECLCPCGERRLERLQERLSARRERGLESLQECLCPCGERRLESPQE